jgi:translation initiation factor 3 subunit L
MVHIAESTVGRRYAGWFIRNTEHAQRVLDALKNSPLPVPPKPAQPAQQKADGASAPAANGASKVNGPRVAWGGVKVAA